MTAFRVALLVKVVTKLTPFHRTTVFGSKLAPWTDKVKLESPTVAELWPIAATAPTGLLIVKPRGVEAPPPGSGLKTVTTAAPGIAMSEARMAAVKVVLPT
jgi:hypothetical protein